MTKSSPFWASCLIPTLTAALFTVSCAGGQTTNTGPTGGTVGSTGGTTGGTASGGRIGTGSGGSTSGSGSGGSTSGSGSGGSTSGSGSGGSSSGSGGSTVGTGTGGSVAGTGTGGGTTVGGALAIAAGYVTGATYKGYAYTFTGPTSGSKAMVMPATFTAATTFCATGSIAIDSTYASVAGMGMNVNQAVGTTATPPPIETVATTGTGLMVNVSATGLTLTTGSASQLRVQVKSATTDFCAPLTAAGPQMIPWAMFNSHCWNTTETGAMPFTAATPIKAVELIIPSGAAAIAAFNICLLDAKPY